MDSGFLGRVTYLGPCTLPDLDLTSSMSEAKKNQAGADIPPTPEQEEDHAHALGIHYKDFSLEDRNHWDML